MNEKEFPEHRTTTHVGAAPPVLAQQKLQPNSPTVKAPVAGSSSGYPGYLTALQRSAGNRAVIGLLSVEGHTSGGNITRPRTIQRQPMDAEDIRLKSLQRLGTPLDKPLPSTDPAPAAGEDPGKQRRYTPAQYIAMWEKEQGRTLDPHEKDTIARGCIGITANNLSGGGNPPLDLVFGTFEQAHKVMSSKNATIEWMAKYSPLSSMYGTSRYIVFAKLFWSNQDTDPTKRKKSNKKAFLPDAKTGRVDMTGYKYLAQPNFVNFDYGFWDESSQSFWHANHADYHDPLDPMIVLQSTREKFAHKLTVAGETRYGYRDFNRVVYGVALASNYNPGLAAMSSTSP